MLIPFSVSKTTRFLLECRPNINKKPQTRTFEALNFVLTRTFSTTNVVKYG